MNYATIKPWDIANGPGVRVSLFVSGCTHHCKDCFNPEAWDFDYGEPFTDAVMDHILDLLRPEYIRGITYLGGEPFDPHNQPGLLALTQKIRAAYPEKSIWSLTDALLAGLDVLVDGPFIAARKNLGLRFRGSDNQRLIDLPKTLKTGAVVLWDETQ